MLHPSLKLLRGQSVTVIERARRARGFFGWFGFWLCKPLCWGCFCPFAHLLGCGLGCGSRLALLLLDLADPARRGGFFPLQVRPQAAAVAALPPCLPSSTQGSRQLLEVEFAAKDSHCKDVLANAFFAERLADADEAIGVLVAVWARLVGVFLLLHHEHPHDDLKPFGELLETFG